MAVEVARTNGFAINDLYALLKNVPSEYHSDMTHYYTKDATKVITEKVVMEIERCIGVKADSVDYDTYFSKKEDALGQ